MKIKVHSKLYWKKWIFWLIQPRPYESHLESHDRYWVTVVPEVYPIPDNYVYQAPRMVDVPKDQYMIMQQPQVEIEVKEIEVSEELPEFPNSLIDPDGKYVPNEELTLHP